MNYIPQIAKMLGVEIGEWFKIEGTVRQFDAPFYFAKNGLCNEEPLGEMCSMVLIGILRGHYKIKKMPWKPKEGTVYYIPIVASGKADYDYYCWNDKQIDLPRYDAGLVCRTKEEAIEKAKKMLAVVKDDEQP